MNTQDFIPIEQLCTHYKIERHFFDGLQEHGLIEITLVETSNCIHLDHIQKIEKMMRLRDELHLNYEGIDTVMNLLERIEELNERLRKTRQRLSIYEQL